MNVFRDVNTNDNLQPTVYLLKHKDTDVVALVFNLVKGTIDNILKVYNFELLPIGCTTNVNSIQE